MSCRPLSSLSILCSAFSCTPGEKKTLLSFNFLNLAWPSTQLLSHALKGIGLNDIDSDSLCSGSLFCFMDLGYNALFSYSRINLCFLTLQKLASIIKILLTKIKTSVKKNRLSIHLTRKIKGKHNDLIFLRGNELFQNQNQPMLIAILI